MSEFSGKMALIIGFIEKYPVGEEIICFGKEIISFGKVNISFGKKNTPSGK